MLSILVSIALSQTVATPQVAPQTPVDVVAPQQPRRICRIDRDTGSRVQARRICQTVQERDQERDQTQRDVAENNARDWDRRMVNRLNEPVPTRWGPNGISGIGGGPR
jgi:hypothetical protein